MVAAVPVDDPVAGAEPDAVPEEEPVAGAEPDAEPVAGAEPEPEAAVPEPLVLPDVVAAEPLVEPLPVVVEEPAGAFELAAGGRTCVFEVALPLGEVA